VAYVIETRYKEDSDDVYADCRARHLEYLTENVDKVLAGGALLDDDGTRPHGGVIILDTDDREEAERFIANDPFNVGGLFQSVTVTRWRKAYYNFERLI
jgi:uncharacterized protein YciI